MAFFITNFHSWFFSSTDKSEYLRFFLHGYEHKLNGKVYSFLRRNGMDTYDPVLFLDMKLALQELILKKLPTYDSSRDTKFLTYLHHFIYYSQE